MSSTIARAAVLKPEIRLAQSVSEFEAGLSDKHKATFRSYRSQSLKWPLDPSDVMRLTAEIDRRAVEQNGGGQCFGPRLTNILQAVQQYAALGDVIIGGSQNIIACGIWSLLRLTLLAAASYSSYMEKLSRLLMVAGRKAPRYEQMALLYPRSTDLQSSLSEYFTVVVQLCHKLYKATQKKTLGSYFSFLSDLDLKEHETSLQLWADCIKDEVILLTARKTTEQSAYLGVLSKNSQYESRRRRLQTRLRILEACSTYDHETTWKEIRKSGNSTLLSQLDLYQEWKTEKASCTLLCTGKLGFGKSVLLANMVDELNLSNTESTDTAVIYFFCRHDIQESLQARTIIGSIIRQLINANLRRLPDEISDISGTLGLDALVDFVLRIIPRNTKAFVILDGLDECDDYERESAFRCLTKMQEALFLNICCSFRSDVHAKGVWELAELLNRSVVHLPEENPDIASFVTAELERCIQSGRLCIGDPDLIHDIHHALVQRARGMFLWVILQIASLCTAQSDEEIREALEDLPRGLPETFSRILQRSRKTGGRYQKLVLQLCMAARRPLTIEELWEALSVAPYNTDWNRSRLINNILSVLSYCGSLITIDEENLTVRFLHHSVRQFLLGDFDSEEQPILTLPVADQVMGEVIITYLNYNIFETSLSTTVFPEVAAENIPSNVIKSTFWQSKPVQQIILKILRHRQPYHYDLRDTFLRERKPMKKREEFEFYAYAQAFCLQHIQWVFHEPKALGLLFGILEKQIINITDKDDQDETLLLKAVVSSNAQIVRRFLEYGSDTEVVNNNLCTALHLAANLGLEETVKCLLDFGANIGARDQDGRTALLSAAGKGHVAAVQCLLDHDADVEATDKDGWTPLFLATARGHESTVITLLTRSSETAVMSALQISTAQNYQSIHRRILGHIARQRMRVEESEARSRADGKSLTTPESMDLCSAAANGHEGLLRLLIDRNTNIEVRDKNGATPLLLAAANGHLSTVKLLLDKGANIHARTRGGKTITDMMVGRDDVDKFREVIDKAVKCLDRETALDLLAEGDIADTKK